MQEKILWICSLERIKMSEDVPWVVLLGVVQEDHQKGRCVIDKATQEAISQQTNLLSGDKGIADGALAALRNVQLGLCDLAGGAAGGVPARLVETLQIALSAAVARLYGLDGSLGTPEGLVLLGSSYCKRENLDNNGAASQRANVRNPHTGAAAFIGGPGSMEGCGRDEGGLFPGFCMHMPTDTAVRRGMPGSRDAAGPAATEITPQQHFLLHRAIASKIPVHYHMPNDPALHGESSSSSAIPEDCMYDAAQYGSRHFAALPLTIRGRLSAVLWLSARATDHPAVQILSHPPSLHQLALSASLCLAATSTAPGAATLCAPSGPDVVAWLAARLRRLAGATSLRNLVSELTETLVQHIRLDFLLDARVQTALVPHPFASTAFLLKPVLPPASSVEANVSFVEGQQGLRKGLVKDLLCNPLGASKLASGPQECTHQRPRSISQNAIHRLPTDQNTGPNAASSAVATASTNSSAFQRRRSLMEGPRSGSGGSTLPTCPNARVVRLFPTTTAGHLTGEFVRHLETPTGSRPATPRGGPSNATRVASLRAKAFHLSHTLMQRMVTHRLAATQAAGAPTVGSESERRVMVDGGAETKHRGVLCGPTVTNCGLWVQNVRHPSRDVYLLMASAAASTLPSTTTVGSSVGSGGSQGVQALTLIGIEAGDGDDGREAAAGSGGDHKVLGLYLLFGSQLPMKLLQAVNANCRDLLGRVLAPLIRAKLSKDLAAELSTVTAGVPGTYAVLSASTSAVAPANPLPNTSGFLGGTAVNPVLLEPFISTAGSTGGPITSGCTQPYVETLRVPPGRMAHLVTRHVDSGVISHDHTEGNATGAPAFLVPFGERGGGGGSVEGSVGGSGADGGPELLLVPYMMPEMGSQEGEITMGAAMTAANTQLNDGSTPPARFDGQARTAPCATATDPVSNMGGTRGSHSAAHRLAAPPIEVPINHATLNAPPSGNTRTQQGPKVVPRKGVQTDATTLTAILSVQEVDASSALATHMDLLVDAITTTLRASRMGMKTATTRQSEEQSRFLMESCGGPPVDDDLEDLHLSDILGEGSSGVVLRGILGTSPVAVKLMELPDDSEDEGASSPGASMATARSRREAATAAAAAAGVQGVDTHPRHSRGARLEMSRTMLRNAMELAVLRTVSHVNIIQCHAVYDNVRIVKLPGGPGKPPVCMLRRATDAEPDGADGHTAAGGSADPSFNIAPPLCTAIVTELCTHGSLAGLLYERSFPRVQPLAPGHAAYNDVRARYDMQGVYLTLLEIALALRHLHARRLVHRDIKPANILLKACSSDPRGWTCKLADFGFALVLDQQQNARSNLCRSALSLCALRRYQQQVAVTPSDASSTTAPSQSATRHQPPQGNPSSSRQPAARGRISLCLEFEKRGSVGAASLESGTAGVQQPTWFTVQEQACGTVTHMAPEAMHSYSRIDASVDVFSFGIIMWELLCGKGNRPYPRLTPDDIPRAVLAGMRPTFTDETPSAYRRLAQACWSVDPRCRPGASELVAAIKSFMGEHARNSRETAMAVTKA